MKKRLKKVLIALCSFTLLIIIASTAYYFAVTNNVNLDESKLIDLNSSIEIYDNNNALIEEISGEKSVINAEDLPKHTINAFIAIEDKRFYSHSGIDVKGLIRATLNNIKSFSLKEGASTITQQLIKNTHLSGEKTLNRKLKEIKLAFQLEKKYSKTEIIEMYLNTIYFGEGCFGINSAARKYFGISSKDLTLNQSAALAGIVKAPSVYSPTNSLENCTKRKDIVLKEMLNQNFITKEEYNENLNKPVKLTQVEEQHSAYLELVKKELNEIFSDNFSFNSKIKVYTYFDKKTQANIESATNAKNSDTDKRAIVLDSKNNITAFYSTCKDIYRPLGSTIKPIAVFAPALENSEIDACTPINDEKTDFDGYSPSNYKDIYYGYVSAKTALAKSLNTCAVKIMNNCGIKKSLSYINKTDIPVTDNDQSLCVALGATEKGATLTQIASSYGTFVNKGNYSSPKTIRKIENKDGISIYNDKKIYERIFGEDTAFLINYMLKDTVTDGTAKKLSTLNIPLSAKTGTVGTEDGNTDAYSISYNGNYIFACWIGNKNNALMSNSITGGTLPTAIAYEFWEKMILQEYSLPDTFYCEHVKEINLDKVSYEQDHKIEKADENFPDRYILKEIFSIKHIPKAISERFSSPNVKSGEISVNNNGILISLCLPQYSKFKIYKHCDGQKFMIYEGEVNDSTLQVEYTDEYVLPDKVYTYSIIPYFSGNNVIKYGKEFYFAPIKTSPKNLSEEWWTELLYD